MANGATTKRSRCVVEQGAVGRGRVGQPSRRDAVAEPQRHREGKEQPVYWTGAHMVMTPRQQ